MLNLLFKLRSRLFKGRRFNIAHKSNRESGLSMVETMITVGLLGAVAIGFTELFSSASKSGGHFRTLGDINDVRTYLRKGMNCSETISTQKALCDAGSSIALKSADGATIVAAGTTSTAMGSNIEVGRVTCTKNGDFYKINAEYRLANSGVVVTDPYNNKPYDWTDLFKSVPLICSNGCNITDQVTFENVAGLVEATPISTQFTASQGITFSLNVAGTTTPASELPVLGKRNSASFPKGYQNNSNVHNSTTGSATAPGIMGTYFLTFETSNRDLVVTYLTPVKSASGYMFDVDGGETFTIKSYGSTGLLLVPSPFDYKIKDGDAGTGDAKETFWSVTHATADISKLIFVGTDPSGSQGIAFDRFSAKAVCP